jgi:hypothetical protein
MTDVAVITLDEDRICVVRHHTGSGAYTNLTEVYVVRGGRFLGRFEIQITPTHDAKWEAAADHPSPTTEPQLAALRKARMVLLSMTDKVWGRG